MAVWAAVKNAFNDGWHRQDVKLEGNDTNYNPNNGIGYSRHFHHHPDAKYNTFDHYNNIPYVSFLEQNKIDAINNVKTDDRLMMVYPYQQYVTKNDTIENNFKIPWDILKNVSRNYKFIYNSAAQIITDFGLVKEPADKTERPAADGTVIEMPVVPSLFNPFYGLNIVGITGNTPLSNVKGSYNGSVEGEYTKEIQYHLDYNNDYEDVSDCSIKKLVELSNKGKMGRAMYKYADFMYCKNLGKIANNRLITLRRFPTPIGDDIWNVARYDEPPKNSKSQGDEGVPGGADIPVDIGRMVTWLDDNNRIEDILNYEYREGFDAKEGAYWNKDSEEENDNRGILGSIVNLTNPTYRQWVAKGMAGSGNKILGKFAGAASTTISTESTTKTFEPLSITGENQRADILSRYDDNRVYEPIGTIRDTYLYTGKIEFTQEFSLVFDYELRAYENINPRTAFLDLLNNIQATTFRTGKWWGGQTWFIGAPGNINGWNNAYTLIDRAWNNATNTFNLLLKGDLNFSDFLGSLANKAAKFIKGAVDSASEFLNDPEKRKDAGKKLADGIKNANIDGMTKGLLLNKLGRPALYTTNSVLSGDPVGLWHVTIGNPRNPIMSMGNLIISNTTVQHYGPLGIDDFPTGLKVTVSLKHAKPRDMIEIGKMYTKGTTGFAIGLGRGDIKRYHSHMLNIDELRYSTSWASTVPSLANGVNNEDEKVDKKNK